MTQSELLDFFDESVAKMRELIETKNHDYAGGSPDAFHNFFTVEKLEITSTERGLLTRMTDKFCRVINFVKMEKLAVKEESFQDTCLDLANYSLILAAYRASGGKPSTLSAKERKEWSQPQVKGKR
jgi:hypothetical protein